MKLNTIQPAAGSKSAAHRVGRGVGSGWGKTAGRGHKGQKSRAGGFHKVGFEGGQMPLQRRLPKFGFKNINRVEYKAINLELIAALAEARQLQKVGIEELRQAGYIHRNQLVKILAVGTVSTPLTVEANAFSAAAKAAIEAAGGTAQTV